MKNILRANFVYIFAAAITVAFSSMMAAAQAFVPAKVAVIQSDAFSDKTVGIPQLAKATATLQAEFKSTQDELNALSARIAKANADIGEMKASLSKLSGVAQKGQQALIDGKTLEIEQMQNIAKSKQALAESRQNELLGPIMEDIGKAVDAFAKSHGIEILIDASKAQRGVIYYITPPDITSAFIADYNAKHAAP